MVVSALPAIPLAVGAHRVVTGRAVPHLLGDPALSAEAEASYRRRLTEAALDALTRPVEQPVLISAGDR